MKVLFLTPYPREGASNRYRVLQYLPFLDTKGITYCVRPFVSPEFYRILYKPGNYLKKVWYFSFAALQRLLDIHRARHYDLIFIHRECFPFGPAFIEKMLTWTGKPIIYDFDDAIYLPTSRSRMKQFLKNPKKVNSIIRLADHVIVCNEFLHHYSLKLNKNVSVIPTPLDTGKFVPARRKSRTRLVIGWVGSHTTTKYLDLLTGVFRTLGQKYDFDLHIVGANKEITIPGITVINRPWTLKREVADFQDIDIGVYPLVEDEWAIGKTGFKTIQYMAVGIPCVVSDVGANKTTIQDGMNGFLARTDTEWVRKLSLLIENPALRRRMGAEGRKTVVKKFSTMVTAKLLLGIFRDLHRPTILHVISDLDVGGTEKILASLVQRIDQQRYRLVVCSLAPYGSVAKEIQRSGIACHTLGVRSKWDIFVFWRLYRLVRTIRPAILQTYLFFDNIVGRIIGRIAHVPVIISGQRYLYDGARIWRIFMDRATVGFTHRIITNSKAARANLIRCNIGRGKIQVIYNGKDFSGYDRVSPDSRLAPLRSGGLVVGIIARLNKVKGHTYFLQAARQVLEVMPNTRFLIVGDGPLRQRLQDMAQRLKLGSAVHFLGNRDNVLPVIAACDLIVLSSLAESFPGALLEAMGMGKATVATNVGGVSELISHAKNGYLVPPRNPALMANQILDLLSDAAKRQRFGTHAKATVRRRFSIARMVAEYEQVYQTLLQRVERD